MNQRNMRNGFLIILKTDLKFTQTFCIVAEKDIFILGIESSCDETGVALVEGSGDAPPRLHLADQCP